MEASKQPPAYAALLKQCRSLGEGRRIHARIVECKWDKELLLCSQLMQMYRRFGRLDEVQKVFGGMVSRDVFSWNIAIAAYVENGEVQAARELFDRMERRSTTTWNTMITAYARKGRVPEARRLFDSMPHRDPVSWSAIISGYAQNGQIEEARRLFDKMPSQSSSVWNAMIAGYAQHPEEGRQAIQLFYQMEGVKPCRVTFLSVLQACSSPHTLADGVRIHAAAIQHGLHHEVLVGNALVSMYGRCGSVGDAVNVFEAMVTKNRETWNAIASVYHSNGQQLKALDVLRNMDLEGMQPNDVTLVTLLDASATMSDAGVSRGHAICCRAVALGYLAVTKVGNAMVDMYGKCSCLERASWVFSQMLSRDIITWTALIVGYASNGQGGQAFELFQMMGHEGMQPDQVIFLSILSACVHAGALKDACNYFVLIQEYGVKPSVEHYSCMVDLLARSGQLLDAEDLIENMPFRPDGPATRALLSACRSNKDMHLGTKLARQSIVMDPQLSSSYALLSDIC